MKSSNTQQFFGKTAELKVTIAKIRAIEATNPRLEKFITQKIPTGEFCNKKDTLAAEAHLAKIQGTASAPVRAQAPRPTAQAPTLRQQYEAIKEPSAKRAFREKHWNQLFNKQ
jgi:hypothetical protein